MFLFIFFDFLNNENVDNFVLILNFKYLFFDKKKIYGFVKMLFKRKVCNDYFIWKM